MKSRRIWGEERITNYRENSTLQAESIFPEHTVIVESGRDKRRLKVCRRCAAEQLLAFSQEPTGPHVRLGKQPFPVPDFTLLPPFLIHLFANFTRLLYTFGNIRKHPFFTNLSIFLYLAPSLSLPFRLWQSAKSYIRRQVRYWGKDGNEAKTGEVSRKREGRRS